MGICNISIKTDLKNKSYNTLQACKQGDTLILNFDIFDNSMMADLTGFVCDLRANKGDNRGYEIISGVAITVSTGKATIKCPTSLTQFAGKLLIELTFTDTVHGLQKTTFDIAITVDKSVMGNSDGSAPLVIITALEELNTNLAQISGKVTEAKEINNTLTNTNNTASSLNSALQASKNSADISKSNLESATNTANSTIDALKQANTSYTQHINNADIHLTLEEKKNVKLIPDIVHLLDVLTNGMAVTDDANDPVTTETGEVWTM